MMLEYKKHDFTDGLGGVPTSRHITADGAGAAPV